MNITFNKRCDGDRWDYGTYQDFGDNVIRCHHERGVLCGRGEDRLGRNCSVYMQLESCSARRGGDGGHAMILRDFPGNLLLVFHQPNIDADDIQPEYFRYIITVLQRKIHSNILQQPSGNHKL